MIATELKKPGCSAGGDRQGVYLYCLTRPSRNQSGADFQSGQDGLQNRPTRCEHGERIVPTKTLPGTSSERAEIETLVVQDVAVVFARVCLADWEWPADDSRLRDSQWLIPRALEHEQIIEAHMAQSPVLPVRFGAVFSCEAALIEFVAARSVAISQFLDRVGDAEEWAVKGFLDLGLTQQWLQANDAVLADRWLHLPDSPGARYFQEKRLKADIQRLSRQWGYALAEKLSGDLNPQAVSMRTLRFQQAAEADREMVFHAAFLLPRSDVGDFLTHVQRVQNQYTDQGLTLQTTGPWPPYNFCPDLVEEPL